MPSSISRYVIRRVGYDPFGPFVAPLGLQALAILS